MLEFIVNTNAPGSGDHSDLEHQERTISKKIVEIQEIEIQIQEKKFETGSSADDVKTWTDGIEQHMKKFEATLKELRQTIKDSKEREREENQRKEEQVRAEAQQRQLEFEQEKLKQRLKYEQQLKPSQADQSQQSKSTSITKPNIKLHKLEMTKFNGTYEDWLRFWNQFEAEVHAADIPAVTKFTYLKESLDPKVRVFIDGLPFTTEGHKRARNILKSRYTKTSEIIYAYVQNILALPTIHSA